MPKIKFDPKQYVIDTLSKLAVEASIVVSKNFRDAAKVAGLAYDATMLENARIKGVHAQEAIEAFIGNVAYIPQLVAKVDEYYSKNGLDHIDLFTENQFVCDVQRHIVAPSFFVTPTAPPLAQDAMIAYSESIKKSKGKEAYYDRRDAETKELYIDDHASAAADAGTSGAAGSGIQAAPSAGISGADHCAAVLAAANRGILDLIGGLAANPETADVAQSLIDRRLNLDPEVSVDTSEALGQESAGMEALGQEPAGAGTDHLA